MARIEFEDGAIAVEAELIGEGLGLDPAQVQAAMREGRITSLCERGEGEDSGRYRLTFYAGERGFRLIVDESGRILRQGGVDLARHPLARFMRRRPPARGGAG